MPQRRTRQRKRGSSNPERVATVRKQHTLLLALLVLIVFASTLAGGFVWNDREDLLQGAHRIDSSADIGAALTQSRDAFRALTLGGQQDPAMGSWQPLVVLSNSLSWMLWRDCAFCYHLENLLLHVLLVIGVYALGRHLLSRRRHGNRIAAWAAAMYAVHPATVSSVAWIGGRTYLLAALFSVWTLVIFTRLPATVGSRKGHVRRWLIGLGLLSACAMLSHETAMMLPAVALLIAVFESMQRDRHPFSGISSRRYAGLAVLLCTLLLLLAYRKLALGGLQFPGSYPTDSIVNNLGTAVRHLWFLIQETLLPGEPIVSDAWPITRRWSATEAAAVLGLLVRLITTGIGLWLRHPSALGVSWFLLWLIPGVGLFPTQHYYSSHTLLLAVWGATFALAFAILQLWRPVNRELAPGSEALAFVPVILVLGVITAFSNARWWDHRGLFEAEIASDPHYIEGRIELAKEAMERDEGLAAINHLSTAIESSRNEKYTGHWPARDAYVLLGKAFWKRGMYGEAADSFANALESAPDDAQVVYWLGVTELSQRQFAAAEESFRLALKLQPQFPEAEADLGTALAGQQRYIDAYPLLASAIDGGLGNARRHQALAATFIDARRLQDGARHLEKSLALHEDAVERARLAWVYWRLGDVERARNELSKVDEFAGDAADPEFIEQVRSQLSGTDEPEPAG